MCDVEKLREVYSDISPEMLRENTPIVVEMGEMRTREEMTRLLNAALTGHTVLATVSGPSVEQALTRCAEEHPLLCRALKRRGTPTA